MADNEKTAMSTSATPVGVPRRSHFVYVAFIGVILLPLIVYLLLRSTDNADEESPPFVVAVVLIWLCALSWMVVSIYLFNALAHRLLNKYSRWWLRLPVAVVLSIGAAMAIGQGLYLLVDSVTAPHEVRRIDVGRDEMPINSLAFSANGRRMLTGNRNGVVRLWDVETGRELRSFNAQKGAVVCVAFSADERRALAGIDDVISKEYLVHLWDLETGQELQRFKGHKEAVNAVGFSADGRHAYSGSRDANLRTWDCATGQELVSFDIPPEFTQVLLKGGSRGQEWAFLPDRRHVLTGGNGDWPRVWDLQTGQQVCSFGKTKQMSTHRLALSADGKRALTADFDGRLHIWDVATGNEVRTIQVNPSDVPEGEGKKKIIGEVALSPSGRFALAQKYADKGCIRLWDVETGEEVRVYCPHRRQTSYLWSAAFTPDGKYAVSSGGLRLHFWELPP